MQPKASSLPRLMQQLFVVGVQSLIIMLVSALFIGMVLGLQGYTLLSAYGSEQAVGQMVALTLVRELSPVVAALLFAGRAGSALTAEIGLMKATEQLASLEMFGIDLIREISAMERWADSAKPTSAIRPQLDTIIELTNNAIVEMRKDWKM